MAATGASPGVFEGCISAGDTIVERRPYHRNCGCALHGRSRGAACPRSHNRVSYPMRRAWSEGSLALAAAAAASSGHSTPPSNNSSSSPALAVEARRGSTSNLAGLGNVEEEEY